MKTGIEIAIALALLWVMRWRLGLALLALLCPTRWLKEALQQLFEEKSDGN